MGEIKTISDIFNIDFTQYSAERDPEIAEMERKQAERIFKSNLNAGIKEPIEVLEIVARCIPEIKIKWS